MRLFTHLIAICIFLFFLVSPVSAHVGGIPIAKINGEYVRPNFAYVGVQPDKQMIVSQDVGSEAFLVGSELSFEFEPQKLGLTEQIISQSEFRWRWSERPDEITQGLSASHTFTTPGSHIIAIEGKTMYESAFSVIDTIQVDVVPFSGYLLPTVEITREDVELLLNSPATFYSKTTTDKRSKIVSYLWKFDESTYLDIPNPTYTFTNPSFFGPIFLQVKDSQGLIATTAPGFYAEDNKIFTSVAVAENSVNNWLTPNTVVAIAALCFILFSTISYVIYRSQRSRT